MSESVSIEPNEETIAVKQRQDGKAPVGTPSARPVAELSGRRGPTVEAALYGVLLVVAFAMRFTQLGSLRPLSPLEAAPAWAAWLDAMGLHSEGLAAATSPLLYTVQRFLFWLTAGGSDAVARLFPALVGSLLVLAPWALRRQLGRGGALALSLLLAIDPWHVVFSRLGDGAILSAASGLLLWIALLNWRHLSIGQLRAAAAVAALLLLSGPLAWLFLPTLLATALLFPPTRTLDRRDWIGLFTAFAAVLLLVGTGWLVHWQGLGMVSRSLTQAFSYLTAESPYPRHWPLLRLLVDQPLLVAFGGGGLALLWWKARTPASDRRWVWLLTDWIVYDLVLLLLLPGRHPALLLLLQLPLALAAATAISHLVRFALTATNWQDGALIAITTVALLVTSYFLTAGYLMPGNFDARVLLFYAILPVLLAFFVWWSGWRTTVQVTGLVALGLLLAATLSSSWMLNLRSELQRGNDLFAVTTQANVHLLADDVAKLNAIRLGDPGAGRLLVAVGGEVRPVLGWYLRFVKDLRFVESLDPALFGDGTLAITPPGETPSLPVAAVGSRYPISGRWLPGGFENWGARLRWVLYRESRELPVQESVVLWVQEE